MPNKLSIDILLPLASYCVRKNNENHKLLLLLIIIILLLLFFEKRVHPTSFFERLLSNKKKSVKFFQCFENIRKKRNAVQLNVYFRGYKRKLKRKKKEARFHETSRWSKHREEQIHKERSWKNLPSAFKAR